MVFTSGMAVAGYHGPVARESDTSPFEFDGPWLPHQLAPRIASIQLVVGVRGEHDGIPRR